MSNWEVSKFLKYQDKNNDGLPDICTPQKPIQAAKCPACLPKPSALIPRWKTKTQNDPFLNQRQCLFQVSFRTPFTDTGAYEKYGPNATEEQANSVLEERADSFAEAAAKALTLFYNKDDSDSSIKLLVEDMEWTDWDLDARPMSHLKFLYSVPHDTLMNLPDAPEEEEEEEPDVEDIHLTVFAGKIRKAMLSIRRALDFYNSNLKVYRALEGKNLFFKDGGVFNLGLYGDTAPFGSSVTENLVPRLQDFLERHGIYLFPFPLFFDWEWSVATEINFTFSSERRLKKMVVHLQGGCKPRVFKGAKLDLLNASAGWSDPTAVGYFAKQNEFLRDIQARAPEPWLDTIINYTYPPIKTVKVRDPVTISDVTAEDIEEKTIMGCIGDALESEFKQLGQDIKDDIFDMADALAAQFHKSLCLGDYKELLEEEFKIGKIDDPGANPNLSREEREKTLFQYAQQQAFKEIKDKDILFAGICARIGLMPTTGNQQQTLDLIWRNGLDPSLLCELMDMMLDVIECLFKGLTFEELLAAAIRSALRAMGVEDFGFLFVGLPPDKQAKLDAMVKQKLASGDIFREGSPGQRLSDSIESRGTSGASTVPSGAPFFATSIKIEKPWENKDIVDEQKRNGMREGPLSGFSPTGKPLRGNQGSQLSRATAVAQIKGIGDELDPNVVMEAYIGLLIEEYSDNLTDLVKMLDKLPGAPVIKYLIATLDCPRPPLFNPTLADFLSDLALPFCKGKWHIGLPRMDNLFAWVPKLSDFLAFLWWLIKKILQQLIIIIIMRLMVWLCELLSDAICAALGVLGDVAMNLPAMIRGDKTLHSVIKDSICGPDSDPAQIEDTIQGIFQSFGDGSQAFSDKEKVTSFVEDLSSAVTRKELTDAIDGQASSTFLNVCESLVEFEYPEFASTFGNRAKAEEFFKNIGFLMPLEARDRLKDFREMLDEDDMMPANPTLCATPEQVEEFCEARAQILDGRASPAQIQKLCDGNRDDIKNNLQDIGDIFQKGIPAWMDENMPPIMSSDPTCDDGLLPFEPKELQTAATDTMKGNFFNIESAFYRDMMGEGRKRPQQWGWLNMVLSDTVGNPYSYHNDLTTFSSLFNFTRYVDYYVPQTGPTLDADGFPRPSPWANQRIQYGAYPSTIAKQLQGEIKQLDETSNYRTDIQVADTEVFYRSFEDLGFIKRGSFSSGFLGLGSTSYTDVDVELTLLPDYGFNVEAVPMFARREVKFTKHARRRNPDLTLRYRDGGKYGGPITINDHNFYNYGFDLELFTNDIRKDETTGEFFWRDGDTSRMVVHKTINGEGASFGDNFFATEEAEDENNESEAKTITWQEYEFIAKDREYDENPLIGTGRYPNFEKLIRDPKGILTPQQQLLLDIISDNGGVFPTGNLELVFDDTINRMWKILVDEIGSNDAAFEYGHPVDNITGTQMEYGFAEGGEFIPLWDYIMQKISEDSDWKMRDLPFGMSRMQYDEENNDGPPNRMVYLDPADYGGKKWNPPFYIKPAPASGFYGVARALYPEASACAPEARAMVDFDEIKAQIDKSYSKIAEDKRLQKDPDCVSEKPYNRILQRAPKSTIEALVRATCKIFASMEVIKSYAVMSKFAPNFSENYSNLFAAFIAERMEEGLKDAQNDVFEMFTAFKDDEFYYAFLEQVVQTYARLVEHGDIREPTEELVRALERMENYQIKYKNPTRRDFKRAKKLGDTSRKETFKNYKYEKVLEGVQATEEDAKLVLQEFITIELDSLGVAFQESLKLANLKGVDNMYQSIGYYVLQNMTANTTLDLHKTIAEEPVGFPEEDTSGLYTYGEELIYSDGTPYVGFYHVHINEEGKVIIMEGEEHTDTPHEELTPLANRIRLPIGNIGTLLPDGAATDESLPFVAETYMVVGGDKLTLSQGMSRLKSDTANLQKNVSEVYPGSMKLVLAEDGPNAGQPVGIEGKLGVRYGLSLSLVGPASKHQVASVEVDALDIPIGRVPPLEADSKLMFCLINNLVDDPAFKLLTKYIFPIPKLLSSLAIYTAMGFVPSIGEVQKNAIQDDLFEKPGTYADWGIVDGELKFEILNGSDGWATKRQRFPGWGRGYGSRLLHFDNWDREELYYTKSAIKSQFKTAYFARKFDPSKPALQGGLGMGKYKNTIKLKGRHDMFVSHAALRHIPWWKRKMLRSNPFNADGEMCKKE